MFYFILNKLSLCTTILLSKIVIPIVGYKFVFSILFLISFLNLLIISVFIMNTTHMLSIIKYLPKNIINIVIILMCLTYINSWKILLISSSILLSMKYFKELNLMQYNTEKFLKILIKTITELIYFSIPTITMFLIIKYNMLRFINFLPINKKILSTILILVVSMSYLILVTKIKKNKVSIVKIFIFFIMFTYIILQKSVTIIKLFFFYFSFILGEILLVSILNIIQDDNYLIKNSNNIVLICIYMLDNPIINIILSFVFYKNINIFKEKTLYYYVFLLSVLLLIFQKLEKQKTK